jgi:high-affinity iron transporter
MKNRYYYLILIVLLLFPSMLAAAQGVTEDYGPVVSDIIKRGDKAMEFYAPATAVVTGNHFSRSYFDIFEGSGMEFTLGLKNNSFMLGIESEFSMLISQCMRGEAKEEVEKTWNGLKTEMVLAVEKYSSGGAMPTFWGLVLQSFLILFREGVEAMLVVASLVAYLRRSGYADKVRVIWHGVGWALVASIGTAWLLNTLFNVSGANREALEGITMLIAAVILVYVSYWLFAKRETERWQAFIRDKMDKAIGRGSLFALGFTAFLAVFREGAETILFYQALISGTAGQLQAVWVGMGLATVTLIGVYLLVRLASIRLPLGLFFGATAILLFMMAFVFTGQGILELQVSRLVPTTRLDGWPMVSWLGVFPTRESILGQAMILLMLPFGWLLMKLKRSRLVCEEGC